MSSKPIAGDHALELVLTPVDQIVDDEKTGTSLPRENADRSVARALRIVSRGRTVIGTLAAEAGYIAGESDRWFVAMMTNLHKGLSWSMAQVGSVVDATAGRLYRRQRSLEATQRRMGRMLRAEAKRAKVQASDETVDRFTGQMSTFLGLVFHGAVRMEDVAFETEVPASVEER